MNKKSMVMAGVAIALIPVALVISSQTAQTQTPPGCVYLQEVSTGQNSIQKTVSVRGLGDNNWNTDFAVPMGTIFNYYIARVYPQNDANYDVTINLKYNNNSSSQVFKNSVPMQRYTLYSTQFRTPTTRQPYQVNMNVGSDVNNVYSVAVLGCQ